MASCTGRPPPGGLPNCTRAMRFPLPPPKEVTRSCAAAVPPKSPAGPESVPQTARLGGGPILLALRLRLRPRPECRRERDEAGQRLAQLHGGTVLREVAGRARLPGRLQRLPVV